MISFHFVAIYSIFHILFYIGAIDWSKENLLNFSVDKFCVLKFSIQKRKYSMLYLYKQGTVVKPENKMKAVG